MFDCTATGKTKEMKNKKVYSLNKYHLAIGYANTSNK